MSDILTRELATSAIREEEREADFVASTETIDSFESILRQNWDLRRFEANPVILWAHDSREIPIGTAVRVAVVGKELHITVKFAGADVTPRAEQVWQGVKQRVIRGMSVGFDPKTVSYEKIDGRDVLVLDDLELMEASVCSIPSNPETLAKLRARALAAGDAGATKDVAAMPRESLAKRGGERNEMDEKDKEIAALKAKLDQRDADVSDGRKVAETERAAKAALERDLAAERAAHAVTAKERDDERDAAVVREVDALIGDKLTPAERDDELEAARANVENFRKRMAKRPSLGLSSGRSAIGDGADPLKKRDLAPAGNDALADEFDKAARG